MPCNGNGCTNKVKLCQFAHDRNWGADCLFRMRSLGGVLDAGDDGAEFGVGD